jgi:hypothetical protein
MNKIESDGSGTAMGVTKTPNSAYFSSDLLNVQNSFTLSFKETKINIYFSNVYKSSISFT